MLKEYAGKRDFGRTPEPAESARRLHYDPRLEVDGKLKSWPVTKGPSLMDGEKRLAVRAKDRPAEYLDFEGNIPKGEYGAGSMIVWDRGRWQPEGDPQKELAKGQLAFTLDRARLKGRWQLVRIRPRSGEKTEPRLLIKSDDAFARGAGDRAPPRSIRNARRPRPISKARRARAGNYGASTMTMAAFRAARWNGPRRKSRSPDFRALPRTRRAAREVSAENEFRAAETAAESPGKHRQIPAKPRPETGDKSLVP
ncbi:MAG: DNA polymerase ligase N-terminal domain-containing protein [Methylocella sp.]